MAERWTTASQMRNLVLIEVKRAGTDLSEHQEQLLRYAFDEGVPLAALNGLVWWLYLPMAGGSWEQRRARTSALSDPLMRRQPSIASSTATVISGEALEKAQREFESRVTVACAEHSAANADPQGLFDLLAETVHEIVTARRETITEFLQGLSSVTESRRALAAAGSTICLKQSQEEKGP